MDGWTKGWIDGRIDTWRSGWMNGCPPTPLDPTRPPTRPPAFHFSTYKYGYVNGVSFTTVVWCEHNVLTLPSSHYKRTHTHTHTHTHLLPGHRVTLYERASIFFTKVNITRRISKRKTASRKRESRADNLNKDSMEICHFDSSALEPALKRF